MQTRFQDYTLNPHLQTALQRIGFINPTPIQEAALPQALEGRDILGCAQTGTGKTGGFAIPMISHLLENPGEMGLILAPTRELAEQIQKVMRSLAGKLRTTLVVGGASPVPQIKDLRRGVDIIIATPGRLIDLIDQRVARMQKVSVLVLDEVDRMLDMGFAPQIQRIMQHVPKERQTMLFSATLPPEIMKMANSLMKDPARITIGAVSKPAENVDQQMIDVHQDKKIERLLQEIENREGKILVFARTKYRTDRVAQVIRKGGATVTSLHGGRSHGQRVRALEEFRRGQCRILVATDLAGRGIDIDDIDHVINLDMPATQEDYVHRIGRTGRNGKTGVAVSFITSADKGLVRKINRR